MTWGRGRTEIERLLQDGELERVTPSQRVVERLLNDSEAHVRLAGKRTEDDPAGSLQLAYDAARKAAAALLSVQGLRATTRGGHVAVLEAVRAQFGGEGGIAAFGRIARVRRRRHESEYPDETSPGVTSGDGDPILLSGDGFDDGGRIRTSRLDRTGEGG